MHKHYNQTFKYKLKNLLKYHFGLIIGIFWVDASYDGSKTTIILIPKVHINGKLTLEWKKNIKNQC